MRPEIAPKTNKITEYSQNQEFKRGQNLSQKHHSQILAQKSSKKEAMRNVIRENQLIAEESECTFDPQFIPNSAMKAVGVKDKSEPRWQNFEQNRKERLYRAGKQRVDRSAGLVNNEGDEMIFRPDEDTDDKS